MKRTRSRSSLAKEDAEKLAKKGSTSSQSDYHVVTRSKAPVLAPKLEIPKSLYLSINLALEAELKLKRCTSKQLDLAKKRIDRLADIYKEDGLLPSVWEYNRDTATSCVPIKGSLVTYRKPAKAAWQHSKKLDIKLKKVAKKRSASSQSDYQKIDKVTRSKASMMAPKFQIPVEVHHYVGLVFHAEQDLKTRPSDEDLLETLSLYKQKLGVVTDHYKKSNQLPSDWQYHPDTDPNSFEPFHYHQVQKKPKKNIPRNPHMDSVPLVDEPAKVAWQNFKKLDETFNKTTRIGLPLPMDEEMFTQLGVDDEFVTFIRDFAVNVFNKSCQMYRKKKNNSKNISNAKVKECKYAKVRPCYLFYMNIEAVEHEKIEVYEINLRRNLNNGAIVLDSFCLGGPEPLGIREGAHISLESIYETPKDDSLTDPEVYYYTSGMVRRTGGYDFYNPLGWNAISEWYD